MRSPEEIAGAGKPPGHIRDCKCGHCLRANEPQADSLRYAPEGVNWRQVAYDLVEGISEINNADWPDFEGSPGVHRIQGLTCKLLIKYDQAVATVERARTQAEPAESAVRPDYIEQIARGDVALILEAPTGRPTRAWTKEETEGLRAAMKELAEDESSAVSVGEVVTVEMIDAAQRLVDERGTATVSEILEAAERARPAPPVIPEPSVPFAQADLPPAPLDESDDALVARLRREAAIFRAGKSAATAQLIDSTIAQADPVAMGPVAFRVMGTDGKWGWREKIEGSYHDKFKRDGLQIEYAYPSSPARAVDDAAIDRAVRAYGKAPWNPATDVDPHRDAMRLALEAALAPSTARAEQEGGE